MSYNNKWHNDDFQNDTVCKEDHKYFSYNETCLQARRPKGKMNKYTWKFIGVIVAAALFGSAATGGALSLMLPSYIDGRVAELTSQAPGNTPSYVSQVTSEQEQAPLPAEGSILTIPQIAKKVGPAVVGVVSTIPRQSYFGTTQSTGSGSGILISQDGYVMTNNHVIAGASEIVVYLSTGEEKEAKVVGNDNKTDLAVLKLEDGSYPYAELGNSDELEVGELSVAIGNPLGMEFAGSVTVGYISALNRSVEVEGKTLTLIQTDAAINSGNSGGALVNNRGQVIGINTLKISYTGVEGLGFAIPIDEAKPVINDLMDHGYVKGRPMIGIRGENLTGEMIRYYNYNYPEGIFVEQVIQGSAAEEAGVKRGDIVTHIDGTRVKTIAELNKIRDTKKAGDSVVLEVDRSGEILKLTVVLGEETN